MLGRAGAARPSGAPFDRSGVRSSLRVRWAGGCTSYSGGWRWRCSSGACCWSPPARTAGTRRTTLAALPALGASSSATPRLAAAPRAENPTRSSCTTADVDNSPSPTRPSDRERAARSPRKPRCRSFGQRAARPRRPCPATARRRGPKRGRGARILSHRPASARPAAAPKSGEGNCHRLSGPPAWRGSDATLTRASGRCQLPGLPGSRAATPAPADAEGRLGDNCPAAASGGASPGAEPAFGGGSPPTVPASARRC